MKTCTVTFTCLLGRDVCFSLLLFSYRDCWQHKHVDAYESGSQDCHLQVTSKGHLLILAVTSTLVFSVELHCSYCSGHWWHAGSKFVLVYSTCSAKLLHWYSSGVIVLYIGFVPMRVSGVKSYFTSLLGSIGLSWTSYADTFWKRFTCQHSIAAKSTDT